VAHVDREQVLRWLRSRGEDRTAELAAQELPPRLDPEEDAATLAHLGVDPQELLAALGPPEAGGQALPA
jgi:hypothetical protein